ncbi:Hypothetical predicted protein [Marmota monax]|uniref:Uncharacterized protein n=1 Tax=Marmota monax TaxID=9995 RepID=A0A5E4ANQ3_MARMO|nr:Hypothetical predicted protein [Marmota monax]
MPAEPQGEATSNPRVFSSSRPRLCQSREHSMQCGQPISKWETTRHVTESEPSG